MKSELRLALVFFAMISEILVLSIGGLWLGNEAHLRLGWPKIVTVVFGLAGLVISFYRAYQWFQKLNGSGPA